MKKITDPTRLLDEQTSGIDECAWCGEIEAPLTLTQMDWTKHGGSLLCDECANHTQHCALCGNVLDDRMYHDGVCTSCREAVRSHISKWRNESSR